MAAEENFEFSCSSVEASARKPWALISSEAKPSERSATQIVFSLIGRVWLRWPGKQSSFQWPE